ncbi:MAG: quinolinate synthase NadA [Thermosulfidibacteraceae bacterium]|jgi:quinolinate synthase
MPLSERYRNLEFKERVERLKREKKAVILAHYYQRPEIQDVADFIGDSLELAKISMNLDCKIIVFCGVYFMAEIAKILNPDKKVLIPHRKAGCILADSIDVEELKKKKEEGYYIVSYVNTCSNVKAISDIICTSRNALKVVESVNHDRILFVPDKNLGAYCRLKTGKNIELWDGYCPVHERVTLESIRKVKERFGDALVVAHPECPEETFKNADFIGSTSQIIGFILESDSDTFIVGTESGIIYTIEKELEKRGKHKKLLTPDPIPICDQMKMITTERLIRSLEEEIYEVVLDPEVAELAKIPIIRMFNL